MRFSLKKKTILMIISIAVLMTLVCVLCTFKGITDILQNQYRLKSEDLCYTVGSTIDVDALERVATQTMDIFHSLKDHVGTSDIEIRGEEAFLDYLSHYSGIEEMEEYKALQEWLREMYSINHVEFICAITADLEKEAAIYLVDSSQEEDDDFCPPGSFDYFTEKDKESMKHPEGGFDAEITRMEEYGWLLCMARPVKKGDEVIAYIEVGVSMDEIIRMRNVYLIIMSVFMFVMVVFIGIVGSALVNLFIIRPVNILSDAAREYCGEGGDTSHHAFSKLNIHTGDEIEALATSMAKMEEDINDHIERLLYTTNELISAREHELELDRLANVDGLTLTYNKRAYNQEVVRLNQEIERGEARFGLCVMDLNNLKRINDLYGHEKGDIGIKTLCSLVRDVFQHSSVFRFGGDEFVVLLENGDYQHCEELYHRFLWEQEKRQVDESLPPWRTGSAAIGYSLYRPGEDCCVDEVLARADAAMYQDKRERKAHMAQFLPGAQGA